MPSRYRSAFAGFSGYSFAAHPASAPEAKVAPTLVARLPARKVAAKRVVRDETIAAAPRDQAA